MAQKGTRTPVSLATLFTIAKTWKQCKCPSTEEWIKKIWYIYTMEYYSPIQRNRIVSFAEIWMDLQTVILSMYCILYVLILYINAYMQNLEKLYR